MSAVTIPELRAGAFITPNVKLLHPLAEGGMGRVWVAEHLGLNTKVVVKMMADVMLAREDGAERFAREAAAAAAIKSPHVCQVFDHGVTKGESGVVPYIVMELLDGRDLGAYLVEHPGPMDPMDVVAIVTQVGKALARAHKAGIVHRDIKPDNIFLCETDDGSIFVKLLDFGTAKKDGVADRDSEGQTLVGPPSTVQTLPGQIMGTPYYMSPEQSVGGEIDERSDIWSLGVVAFEALTGRKPFDGTSISAITIAIHGPLPKITAHVPLLPVAVDEWFERACARAPADRFQSVREAMSAFVLAVTGNALTFDPPTESVHLSQSFRARSFQSGPTRALSPSPDGAAAPVSISTRPQAMMPEPLIKSLPPRGSEKRPTMIAAGLVVATAAITMMAIVLSRSSAPSSSAGSQPHAPSAAMPAPSPSPIQAVAPPPLAEPEPSSPSAEAPPTAKAAAKQAAKAAPSPSTPASPSTNARALLTRTNAPAPSSAPPSHVPAGPDDDLAALSKAAAKHSVETPAAPPSAAPAPALSSLPPE